MYFGSRSGDDACALSQEVGLLIGCKVHEYFTSTGALIVFSKHDRYKSLLFFQQFYCNLGWDLLASDVNDDGFDDVIVGSPFAAASGEQRGFVAALFADERLGMSE